MAIISSREMPGTSERRFGERFVAERRFVITHDGTVPSVNAAAAEVGVTAFGQQHPEYPIGVVGWNIEENYEGSQYHVLLTLEYGGEVGNDPNAFVAPTLRPAVWSFQTQGTTVPALYYYNGSGNGDLRPLTNSAFDYFEGLTTDESQVKVLIKENRTNFPNGLAFLTNTINSTPWIGGQTHTWKCQGISAELRWEIFGELSYRFWAVTVELLFRQTGWPLQLPDVGFNYLDGGQKRRGMVFDFENAEWVASPGPIGLDGSGNQTLGAPAVLTRRVHREIDFNSYFALPPS